LYDLHTHTVCSDSSATPAELVTYAKEQGLSGIAVTDHDTMRGVEAARAAGERIGIRVLPGAEISAIDPATARRVHILCYAPAHPERLQPVFERVSGSREESCLRSLALLEDRYPIREEDVRLFSKDADSLFRAHLMRALMARGYANHVFGSLYEELFGRGHVACVPVSYIPMEEAAAAIREAGGVAVLAHPGVYDSFESAERLGRRGLLDGIEAYYPRRKDGDAEKISALAERFSLIQTGGTDFHGFHSTPPHPVGTCRTSDETVQMILELAEKRK
jgi:hypothetical protein